MFSLLHSDIKYKNVICSDINNDLITLWNKIKNKPEELISAYSQRWNELNKDEDIERKKQYFYSVRSRFNKTRNPDDFLFLSRTCTNGLIRYNSKGDFNTSLHFTRKGIEPETFQKILDHWSKKLVENDVTFIRQDYKNISTGADDFMYLDPPYANTKGIYYGTINYLEMWDWLRNQKGRYLLSFNGVSGNDDNTYEVPKDIYDKHEYIYSGCSSFKRVRSMKTEYVEESLYCKTG